MLYLPERMPTPLLKTERIPTYPLTTVGDSSVFMNNVKVTPPLITRCDKGTQTPFSLLPRPTPRSWKETHGTTLGSLKTQTSEGRLPPSVHYKAGSEASRIILLRDMEDELAFTLNLAVYQEADLGDYITFMTNFRGVLNRLKPSEVIELETVYAVNIIELMMQVLPDHEPHEVPGFQQFSHLNPLT
ncbi:hypothetical protein TNCV_4476681 [Trichonephila clavipes]|nr:hypothetical protein TNCV_4476681 [Trichonephila clavipes]